MALTPYGIDNRPPQQKARAKTWQEHRDATRDSKTCRRLQRRRARLAGKQECQGLPEEG